MAHMKTGLICEGFEVEIRPLCSINAHTRMYQFYKHFLTEWSSETSSREEIAKILLGIKEKNSTAHSMGRFL